MSTRIATFWTRNIIKMASRYSPASNQLAPPRAKDERNNYKTSSRPSSSYDNDPRDKDNKRFDNKHERDRGTTESYRSDRTRDSPTGFRSGNDRADDKYRDRDRTDNVNSFSARDRSGDRRNDRYDNRYENRRDNNDRHSRSYGYENDRPTSNRQSTSYSDRPKPSTYGEYRRANNPVSKAQIPLAEEMKEMFGHEFHHIVHKSDSNGPDGIPVVEWCPVYKRPEITRRINGGTQLLHHRCRGCRRICLHLMGKPGTKRTCLACGGYDKDSIPEWYYHDKGCIHCKYQ